MLCLPVRIAFGQLNQFFMAQKIQRPAVVCSTSGMILNLVFGWAFVLGVRPYWSGWGFHACPWVTTIVEYAQFFILWLVFCYVKQLHTRCWPGWSLSHVTRNRVKDYLGQYVPQACS